MPGITPPAQDPGPHAPDPAHAPDHLPRENGKPSAFSAWAELPEQATNVLAAFVDYVSDVARLQGHRLGAASRAAVLVGASFAAAGALAFMGLAFVSVGAGVGLGQMIGSAAGGWILVGAAQILLAILGAAAVRASARRRRTEKTDESSLSR